LYRTERYATRANGCEWTWAQTSPYFNTPTQEHLFAAKGKSCLQAKAAAALVHRSAPCPAALVAAPKLCFASTP